MNAFTFERLVARRMRRAPWPRVRARCFWLVAQRSLI